MRGDEYLKSRHLALFSIILFNHDVIFASSQALKQPNPAATTFFVATNGNDQWSGRHSTPAASGDDGPFATLQRARNAARALKQKGNSGGCTVFVRGGIYQLNETLVLGPEDSGTDSHPLVFKAFEHERPVLTGTRRVSGFVPSNGKIYKAVLPDKQYDAMSVRQLFSNGKRQISARYPNFDPRDPIGGGFLYVEKSFSEGNKREFSYKNGSVPGWSNLQTAEIVIFPGDNWTNNILPIQKIDIKARTIALSQEASHEIKRNNRYYLQNFFDALDSPGEWYFDRPSKSLYFWPVDDSALGSVSVSVLKSIIEIKAKKHGNYNGTPSNIRIEGFTLAGCDGSAVVLNGATKTTIAGNTISNAGDNGIEIQDGFENTVFGNDIFSVGHTGIIISGGDQKTLTPGKHRAVNNHIHDTGVFQKGGASGILCKGVGNVASHNLIHSAPRVGIWFEGNDHLIEYNHVHHVNQETQDSGMIYCSQIDWTKRGSVVRYNFLHNSGGYGLNSTTGSWKTPYDTFGIYLDDWSSGTTVYGNIVTNTASGGIFIHSGRDNIVENNVIINGGRLGQMVYSAWLPNHAVAQKWLPLMFQKVREMEYTKYPLIITTIKDIPTGAKMSGNVFVRNIVNYVENVPLFGIYNDFDFVTTISDFNIIYHGNQPLQVTFLKAPVNQQWSVWQNKGFDKNSIIANPKFIDVAKGNFTLAPGSPALKLGFKQIPFEKIGPYKDPLRASWPIKENN